MGTVRVNGGRLLDSIAALARIGRDPGGGITRPAYSPADMEARRWLAGQMAALGLAVAADAVGNVTGRFGDSDRAILVGSHTDTVPHGGSLDGALGVLAALECVRTIQGAGRRLPLAVEVVSFEDEEGRFYGLLGSSAFVGALTADAVRAARDPNGVRLVDAMEDAGYDPAAAARAARPADAYAAYLELHIEQGPRLESAGVPIAVVEGIVGIRRLQVAFEGRPDHAGTTPMAARRDAFAAATRYVARAETALGEGGTAHTVWNVGVFRLAPGVANIVPARAELILEFRDPDLGVMDALEAALRLAADGMGAERGTPVQVTRILDVPPTPMHADVRAALAAGAQAVGLGTMRFHSGGGHDAMMVARLAPAGMLFVPSVGGRSHCPEEDTRPEDIEAGANVLLQAILALAGA